MGSSGGSNTISQIGSALNQGIDFVTSYNPSTGKFADSGSSLGWINSGVGAVTGANESRAALGEEEDQFNQTQQEQQQMIQNQAQQSYSAETTASSGAASARAAAAAQGGINFGNSTPSVWGNASPLGSQSRTFLGV